MDFQHLFPSSLLHSLIPIFFFFFFLIAVIPTSYSEDHESFATCNQPYNCGKLQGLEYPFWGGDHRPDFCGHQGFMLRCQENDYPLIDMENETFRVEEINETDQTMLIARKDVWEGNCPEKFTNTTLNETLFNHGPDTTSINIFYGCPTELSTQVPNHFICTINGSESGAFYLLDGQLVSDLDKDLITKCKVVIRVLIPAMAIEQVQIGILKLKKDALNQQFGLEYYYAYDKCSACKKSGGICGSNSSSLHQFVCHCRDQPHSLICQSHGHGLNLGLKLLIGFGAAGISIIMMLALFFIYQRRNKKRYLESSYVSRNISDDYSSMNDLEKMGNFFGLNIFTYAELEEATNKFDPSKELGDGGFGIVYHGKLKDGRVVAVKRLYENNYKRVEQFMNEVEILTRLRHQNLVLLYGCTSRLSHELLLVYEYIPNGTVADHLHGEKANPGSLQWPTRLKIAIETACALTYLHACEIIHRDVKTNNILLDNNFCVKVADFGLSRLFPTDVTHVSTAPQGTPGYVDPDYHQCYQLTDKSDVYSFGVVLIELISSKPAVDITRHRHEINLANMAINKIQNRALHELVDLSLGFESDRKVKKMITAVAELAFQCLQNDKDMRPSMVEVLESLKDIQGQVTNVVKPEEVHIPADDVVLLKNCPLQLSPASVTVKWSSSTSTTPNASG